MVIILILVAIVIIAAILVSQDFFKKNDSQSNEIQKINTSVNNSSDVNYNFNIVGEGFYQQNLKKIAGPKEEISKFHECTAKITSEPTNKFDKDAVKVEINGLLVGYLSRSDAQKLAGKRINRTVDAVINGGWDDDIDEGQYGVKLAVKNVSDLI
ncbi:hypothetical protein EXE10_17130 [Acinetobacter sp. WCHAc060033]|uniref:hypothetical protein n=1 Tax=Acinetobacter sp. WCHAc060033 TaxID=2518624 RepID=UPI001023AB5B|nr:hypothetical protein [Acinetobacter sp. WCHAc060033]RZG78696.1 hypothetical protein EXE10_17130 [Acinetobacter sp. WCHAc060033]